MPERNKTKFKETQTLLINTRKLLQEMEDNSEGEEIRFKKQLLEVEIPKINKQAQILMEQLADECLANTETEIPDAVKKLEEIG